MSMEMLPGSITREMAMTEVVMQRLIFYSDLVMMASKPCHPDTVTQIQAHVNEHADGDQS